MNKTIKITYTEQSKSVVATTSVEYTGNTDELPSNEEVLAENQELFNKAQSFSIRKTMQK